MKQKLGLAAALIHRPPLLLLDEPTGGVDPVTRQDFWQLIIRLLGEGTGVVVSTPYMDEAVRCNRLGFMYGGRVLTSGAPRELMAPLAGRILELTATPRNAASGLCAGDPDVEDVGAFGERLHLRLRPGVGAADGVTARLAAALGAAGVTVTRPATHCAHAGRRVHRAAARRAGGPGGGGWLSRWCRWTG